jgi:hypothetical protein
MKTTKISGRVAVASVEFRTVHFLNTSVTAGNNWPSLKTHAGVGIKIHIFLSRR